MTFKKFLQEITNQDIEFKVDRYDEYEYSVDGINDIMDQLNENLQVTKSKSGGYKVYKLHDGTETWMYVRVEG